MGIEEIKELAIIETKGHWEIHNIFENKTHYFVCFKGKDPLDTGVPDIRIDKQTKEIIYMLFIDFPDDIKQIA